MQSNLAIAFPNKSAEELSKIRQSFSKHFFNVIVEIIKMISASRSFVDKKVRIQNQEVIDGCAAKANDSIGFWSF